MGCELNYLYSFYQRNVMDPDRSHLKVAGKLRDIVVIKDDAGKAHKFIRSMRIEFYLRDAIQVAIGAALLGIPLSFSEEVWTLGETLPLLNIVLVTLFSLLLIAVFAYYNYYRGAFKRHSGEFFKRVVSTYLISFVVVTIMLSLIQVAPWMSHPAVAFSRTVLVAFPASMSATVVDLIR